MSDSFVRDLRAAAAAGVPIVCVVTHEERRARALIGEAFRGARVLEWTATRGWADEPAAREPLAALERAARAGETGVARVMLDLHPWLDDPRVVRSLRDLAGVRRDIPLVLVMPIASLPAELDRDARVLPLPLPDADALAALLEGAIEPAVQRGVRPRGARPHARRGPQGLSRGPLAGRPGGRPRAASSPRSGAPCGAAPASSSSTPT